MSGVVDAAGVSVSLPGAGTVLTDVSLAVAAGEVLAVVGESGAGKSVLARTLLGLTQDMPGARVTAESLSIVGVDLLRAGRRARRRLRGGDVALVLQDALQSLDPLRTIEAEVGEALAVRRVPRLARRRRVIDALTTAGLDRAEELLPLRSEELSGGMRQRALIASAIAGAPRLVVADEPTTALDATTAAHVLSLLGRLREAGTALVLISHDLRAVARIADRIAVLDAGRIVESGPAAELLARPAHPTTRALVDAIPSGPKPGRRPLADSAVPLITATSVSKSYRTHARPVRVVRAVEDASAALRAGETLGIVGESGSGKSTLARLLTGAEAPDTGTVALSVPAPRIRLVPQDPLGSFDPRHTVARILRYARHDDAPEPAALLQRVGLDPALLPRRPATLSGGQRQRVAIARALAARPDVLVCDEPVSALDMTTQSAILDLLLDLQREEGLGIVFISHDLAVVRRVSDRVIVLQRGRVVERGDTEDVLADPQHPFTRELIAASDAPARGLDRAERPETG